MHGKLPCPAKRESLPMKEGTNQIDNSQFSRRLVVERLTALILILAVLFTSCDAALAYAFNMVVADVRQPLSVSGGSACPVRAHQLTAAGNIALRWSTALGSNPVTILTQTQDPAAQLSEIEQSISTSLATWTAVSGTSLQPASVAPPTRVASAGSCGADGVNSLRFAQPDPAFTPGSLAVRRLVSADRLSDAHGGGQ